MSDALDRTKGAMMLDMPIDYRMQHGRICTTTQRTCLGCGRASPEGGRVSRVAECWLCAMVEDSPCDPFPEVVTDADAVRCPGCRAKAVVERLNGDAKKKDEGGCEHEDEMRRERAINDRKRLQEAMRRERAANDAKRVDMDRQRRARTK